MKEIVFLLFPVLVIAISLSFSESFSASSSGILIPLYVYPENSSSWQPLVESKLKHPEVPIFAIINPNNGPGSAVDPQYGINMPRLDAVGITTLGYVATSWTEKPLVQSKNEIDTWVMFYPTIDGVFFDEMSNLPGNEAYYAELTSYAKNEHGLTITVGNPGTKTIPSYFHTVDSLVIHENDFLPDLSDLSKNYSEYDKKHFSVLVYAQDEISSSLIDRLSNHVSLLYVTDDKIEPPSNDHDPWETVSSHIDIMTQTLDRPSIELEIESRNVLAKLLHPLQNHVTIKHADIPIRKGFSPLFFNGTSNFEYDISVTDFANFTFSNWENGSENNNRIVNSNKDLKLMAIYQNTNDTVTTVKPSRAVIDTKSDHCFLLNANHVLESSLCKIKSVTSNNLHNNFFVKFEGKVDPPKDKKTQIFSSNKNNLSDFPLCYWIDGNDNIRKTHIWKEIISPNGDTVLSCKFSFKYP